MRRNLDEKEIFLAPTAEQLAELEERYGLYTLKEADVLREMGIWKLMLVIRVPEVPK